MRAVAYICGLAALLLLPQSLTAADTPTNVSLPALANSFWTPSGLKLPTKELVAAVNQAKLPVLDAFGRRREVVLMSIASEFAFQRLFDVFLMSLKNITFTRPDGRADDLARHLVVRTRRKGKGGRGGGGGRGCGMGLWSLVLRWKAQVSVQYCQDTTWV